jgi:hypothetical protein
VGGDLIRAPACVKQTRFEALGGSLAGADRSVELPHRERGAHMRFAPLTPATGVCLTGRLFRSAPGMRRRAARAVPVQTEVGAIGGFPGVGLQGHSIS